MTMAESDRFREVNGLIVPREPWDLLLELESRGFRLRPDGSDLRITPFSQLGDEDVRQIRRWKLHLLAMLSQELLCA
jgi:hypothetical protein